jgi:hypothetical protein
VMSTVIALAGETLSSWRTRLLFCDNSGWDI